jgi:hypothetical protein
MTPAARTFIELLAAELARETLGILRLPSLTEYAVQNGSRKSSGRGSEKRVPVSADSHPEVPDESQK